MGEGDVQAEESPLARAANQLRIPLRERRKLSTAASEVAKSVADDEPARRSEREEILRALESSAREVLAAAVRAQRAEESGEEPSTPVAEDNGHVERLCAAVQAALDHRACATCAGWGSGIGEMLRLDRLKIGSSGAGVGASSDARPPEARTAAAALEAFERDLEPASSRFNVFRPQAATGGRPGGSDDRVSRGDRATMSEAWMMKHPPATPAARVRGWIHRALNAGELANKVAALSKRHDITRAGGHRNRCYDPGALIADEEAASRLLGVCVGLGAVKFDLPTDAETLEALFSSKVGGGSGDDLRVRDDAEVAGSNPAGGAGAGFLNKTWGAVTAVGGTAAALGGHAATGVGALGGHAAAGVAAIGTGAHALGTGAVTGVATGVKTVGEGVKTVGEGALSGVYAGVRTVAGMWAPTPGPGPSGGLGGEEDDLLSDMRDVLAEEGVALLDERIDLGGGIGG
jgi:hypothetical protein